MDSGQGVGGAGTERSHEVFHRGGTGEGDPVWPGAQDGGRATGEFGGRDCAIGFADIDISAAAAKLVGENIAGDGGAGDQDSGAGEVKSGKRPEKTLGDVLFGEDIHFDVEAFQGVTGGRADGADAAANGTKVRGRGVETFQKAADAVGAGEDQPVVRGQGGDGVVERAVVRRRLDGDGREFHHMRAQLAQTGGKGAGLIARSGDDDGLSEKGEFFVPAQLVAETDDIAHDDGGGRLQTTFADPERERFEGAGDDFLIRAGAPAYGHGGGGGGPAACDDALGDGVEM